MIVIKVELHSAITGQITEIARTVIWNTGGTRTRGNYGVGVFKKSKIAKSPFPHPENFMRVGEVFDYPRLSYNVWRLVIKALCSAFPEEKAKYGVRNVKA